MIDVVFRGSKDCPNLTKERLPRLSRAGVLYVFDGEIVSRDALGNILYGYLGKVCGLNGLELAGGAGLNQISSGNSNPLWFWTLFDDPRDSSRIREGIQLYRSRH